MIHFIKSLIFILLFTACGNDANKHEDRRSPPGDKQIEKLQQQILALQGTAAQITSLINSDFATCPASGDTADDLVRKICQVAQAATVEARVQMKGELSDFAKALSDKLNATNDQLGTLQSNYDANVVSVAASLATINSSITTLQTQMTSANSAITTLQAQVASISGSLTGVMNSYDIGVENAGAGPVYESILRKQDKSRVNGYVSPSSTWLSLGNNPVTPTNGSATITVAKTTTTVTISNGSPAVVTWTSHGWSNGDPVMFSTSGSLPTGLTANTLYYVRNGAANTFNVSTTPAGSLVNTSSAGSGTHSGSLGLVAGDIVAMSGIAGGSGIGAGYVTGEYVVKAGATTASFQVDLARVATSNSTFGGNTGIIRRSGGRGLGTVWVTADGADTTVRMTSVGTQRYYWIIKANGDFCYDTAVPLQTFPNLSAGGGTVVCK